MALTIAPSSGVPPVIARELDHVEVMLAHLVDTDDAVLRPMLGTIIPDTGLRLRAALALIVGQFAGPQWAHRSDAVRDIAIGVEVLHAAGSTHATVEGGPGADAGVLSRFVRVANGMAILIGDYLFTQAAARCVATADLRVVGLFAQTLEAMTRGQLEVSAAESQDGSDWQLLSRADYSRIMALRTGSSFVLACEGAGRVVDLPAEQLRALRSFSENLALAYQIVDDIRELRQDAATEANQVGRRKTSLPVVLLGDASSEPLSERLRALICESSPHDLLSALEQSGTMAAALVEARALIGRACETLRCLPAGVERTALEALAWSVTDCQT